MTPERIAELRERAERRRRVGQAVGSPKFTDDATDVIEMLDKIERLQALAHEILEEFEDAYVYAGDYFIEKWGYAESAARFRKELKK